MKTRKHDITSCLKKELYYHRLNHDESVTKMICHKLESGFTRWCLVYRAAWEANLLPSVEYTSIWKMRITSPKSLKGLLAGTLPHPRRIHFHSDYDQRAMDVAGMFCQGRSLTYFLMSKLTCCLIKYSYRPSIVALNVILLLLKIGLFQLLGLTQQCPETTFAKMTMFISVVSQDIELFSSNK